MSALQTIRKAAAAQDRRNYIRASHAELGDLYAAWDASAHHVEPQVRSSRFGARLAPFQTREAAEQALLEEGAVIEPENAGGNR